MYPSSIFLSLGLIPSRFLLDFLPSPLSLSPTPVMVPPCEITNIYSHRLRPPPPPSSESSSSLPGPTPIVVPPHEITHIYSRRPRPPPSPKSSSSLLGPTHVVVSPCETTHNYSRCSRTPPSPSLEPPSSLLGTASESPSQYDHHDCGALRPLECYGVTSVSCSCSYQVF